MRQCERADRSSGQLYVVRQALPLGDRYSIHPPGRRVCRHRRSLSSLPVHHLVERGVYVTTSSYTDGARAFAQGIDLLGLCEWRVFFRLLERGRRPVITIDDHGRPFRTSATGRTVSVIWSGGRWCYAY